MQPDFCGPTGRHAQRLRDMRAKRAARRDVASFDPGPFDVRLDFLPDDSTPHLPPPPPGASSDGASPPILSALPAQLGLRLEASKGPVDVIVIDRVERPSAN